MASSSESPEIIETRVVLGKRKREETDESVHIKTETVDEPVHVKSESFEEDEPEFMPDEIPDSDSDNDSDDDSSSVASGVEDDSAALENEPEQGEVLWREADEEFPPCATYHKDVHAIHSRITGILDKTVEFLSEISSQSEGLQRLLEQAQETRDFPDPKISIIALLGDAGTGMSRSKVDLTITNLFPGKSSLISALLDTPHVSREVYTIFASSTIHY
jgi:hypothetical protein